MLRGPEATPSRFLTSSLRHPRCARALLGVKTRSAPPRNNHSLKLIQKFNRVIICCASAERVCARSNARSEIQTARAWPRAAQRKSIDCVKRARPSHPSSSKKLSDWPQHPPKMQCLDKPQCRLQQFLQSPFRQEF